MVIRDVGFDADDTLWHTESLFRRTQRRLEDILAQYAPRAQIEAHLHAIEVKNVQIFGYGIKGFTLSMIEAAIEISNAQVKAFEIHEIVEMGKAMLDAPIELIDNVHQILETLGTSHRLILITKGDVLDQMNKIDRSGLASFFNAIEVVQRKDVESYADVFERHSIDAKSFLMIGNSIPSDVVPVLDLGGFGVHVPYPLTAVFEQHKDDPQAARFYRLDNLTEVPDLISRIEAEFTRSA